MNDNDRRKLRKAHKFMGAVPFLNVSTRTSSIRALVDYQAEMKVFRPAIQELIEIIAMGSNDEFNLLSTKIENWITERQKQNWQRPKLMPEIL